ncbi:NAD(P)H-binding protein [Streptomyces purpureus]|uniref:NAD(P)H-binding protein n=1 Tax=Streptomyces purpureus TaxID=1951 RepID=UPI00035D4AE3
MGGCGEPAGPGLGGGARLRIVVAGASGTVGSRVVRMLVPGHAVRALTRDPARAARAGLGGQIVGADHHDGPGLVRACRGADAMLLITGDPMRPDLDECFLAAARRAGVRRVVKLSALAVSDPGARDLMTCRQRETEDLVRSSGMEWTLLRPRAFMSNALSWAASVRESGVVRALHGDSRNACVDPEEVAAAAVRVLTTPGHASRAYGLTGPEAVSAREQTEQLGRALGRPLDFVELTRREAVESWRARYPEPMVSALLESAERQLEGAKLAVTSGVTDLTGRAPGPFWAWAARHTHHFR